MAPSRAAQQALRRPVAVAVATAFRGSARYQCIRIPDLFTLRHRQFFHPLTRVRVLRPFSTEIGFGPEPPDYLSEAELKIFNKLRQELKPTKLEVQDISGGCGSMYGIDIVSEKFAGIPVVKQHRLVNQVLEEEIKNWHGIQLKTKAA